MSLICENRSRPMLLQERAKLETLANKL